MAKGDHIYVKRKSGLYSHHGIDCGNNEVIHFNGPNFLQSTIHRASLEDFAKGDEILILDYDEFYNRAGSLDQLIIEESSKKLNALFDKIRGLNLDRIDMSPDAVITRAESRLGESGFSLGFNNCEHFATWCKTGISNSKQVETIWKLSLNPAQYALRRTTSFLSNLLDPVNMR